MTAPTKARPADAGERGVALVAAILFMTLMSALAIALTTSGRIEVAMGDNEEVYARTRAAAESGLNHAAAVIIQLTANPTVPIGSLLAGPDGNIDPDVDTAAVNADNGILTHLMGGSAPWPLSPGYSYDVRLLDDDDPVLKNGVAFTNAELTAMGAGRPLEAEDGRRFSDVNRRLVIRATGFGPQGAIVQLEQTLTPIPMPALLVNGDLLVAGDARVVGTQGSLHANGDLRIEGTDVTIAQNATASGQLLASDTWSPGGLRAGGMPTVPGPDIRAEDYFDDADFVLRSDGRITNKAESTVYCNAGSDHGACLGVTPPGGTAAFGWAFSGSVWDLSQSSANAATYFVETDARISGSPGSSASPLPLTVVSLGSIEIAGNPVLRAESTSALQFLTNRDLFVHGDLGLATGFDGRVLVREQAFFSGNPTLTGQLIVQNAPSLSPMVTENAIAGSTTLSYNGLVETLSYTVSGWREVR